MTTNIKMKEPDFKFRVLDNKAAVLQAKNIITHEYKDTAVYVYSDDVSLSASLTDLLTKMSEMASDESFNELANVDAEIATAIESALTVDDNEEKKVIADNAKLMTNIALLNDLSNRSAVLFDNIFGDGTLNSVLVARFGRKITPTLVFLLQLVGLISEFGAYFTANELSSAISKFERRIKRV